MQSKVSIVVPVYNKIEYIDMMLKSVYDQLWDNIELILVNDGATDGTRERLTEWESKFEARGYEVVIIDQENHGIPGAVKAGLMRITGDYVCLADCDDMLDPKYVLTMAGWLEEHDEDQWAVCSYNKVLVNADCMKLLSKVSIDRIPNPPLMIEKYLSTLFATEVWIYMVRSNYFRECKVVEHYVIDIHSTQEPGFLFPLIVGNGKLKVIDQHLYNHNCYPNRTSSRKSASDLIAFQNSYRDIIIATIDHLDCAYSLKKKWHVMAQLAHKSRLLQSLKNATECSNFVMELAMDTVELLSTYFKPDPCITAKHIIENDYGILSIAIAECFLRKKAPDIPKFTGRIIGCGALGFMGKKSIPNLVGTPFEPTELWDQSASSEDILYGIPVALPDFDMLMPNDTILIFPTNYKVKAELLQSAANSRLENTLSDSDIRYYLSAYKYPQFYNECIFTIQ